MKELDPVFQLQFKPRVLDYNYKIDLAGNSETHCLDSDLFKQETTEKSAFKCAVNAAQRLYENNSHKLTLCLSGGLDSQAMLSAFCESGVQFKVCFFRFSDNLNGHEEASLIDYCDAFGIKTEVLDFDILDFFDSGKFYDIAISCKTNSPLFAAHAWMAEQLDGIPIFSGQAWTIHKENNSVRHSITPDVFEKSIIYIPSLKEYAVVHYLDAKNRDCISHFFHLNKDLVRAFWNNPYWLNYSNFSIGNSSYDYQHKYFAYLSSGFPLIRPSRMAKLTGFERVYKHYQNKHNSTNLYYFNELFRRPLEKIFPIRTELKLQIL